MRHLKYIYYLAFSMLWACESGLPEFDYGKHNIKALVIEKANSITKNSAKINARINTNNDQTIKSFGVVYSTSKNPTINSTLKEGTYSSTNLTNDYFVNLNDLVPSTTYYARAFATNAHGTAYSDEISFVTEKGSAASILMRIANVQSTVANLVTDIKDNGGYKVTQVGYYLATTSTMSNKTNYDVSVPVATNQYSLTLNNLERGKQYYAQPWLKTTFGLSTGNIEGFMTLDFASQFSNIELLSLTASSMILKTNVTNDGGSTITEKGFCYSTTYTNPNITNSIKKNAGTNTGSYTSTIEIERNKIYYVRAYATNSVGTSYGPLLEVKGLSIPSGVYTNNAIEISNTSAILGGTIQSDGGSPIISKGIIYSNSNSAPTLQNSNYKSLGTGAGEFSDYVYNLLPNTTYYARTYATNAVGTSYGNIITFKTATTPSGFTLYDAAEITHNSVKISGYVGNDGGTTINSKGLIWSTSNSSPTLNNFTSILNFNGGPGSLNYTITGLTPNTTYYLRMYATNAAGTSYSATITFKTKQNLQIGQYHQGGYIGYIFQRGEKGYVEGESHGLIIATNSVQRTWGCISFSLPTSSSLGDGKTNTTRIVNNCSGNTAAKYADDYSYDGYNDWFLPSYIEIQKIASKTSLLSLGSRTYWSSTEDPTNTYTAYCFNNSTNNYVNMYKTSNSVYALPVRQF